MPQTHKKNEMQTMLIVSDSRMVGAGGSRTIENA